MTSPPTRTPVPATPPGVALIGCGAVAERLYAPALRSLARAGHARVAAVVDPDPARRAVLGRLFPGAVASADPGGLPAGILVAIVASPVRYHAAQSAALSGAGLAVLCEKPMAASSAEARAMVAAAAAAGTTLSVGLFRRFFPALGQIAGWIRGSVFGRLVGGRIEEGGPFDWPAVTASFFDPRLSGGGVLIDVGIHVFDILGWWLGAPAAVGYRDDAEGGVESTARAVLSWGAASGPGRIDVLLSRDRRTRNLWCLDFERASVRWTVGEAARLELRTAGSAHWMVCDLASGAGADRRPADGYNQAFTRQILNAIRAASGAEPLRVPGAEGVASLELVERCYRCRRPLCVPMEAAVQ